MNHAGASLAASHGRGVGAHASPSKTGAHLLKHAVTADMVAAAIAAFDVRDAEEAAHIICRLRQPDLRSMFLRVFGTPTTSGNNDWMRGKLLQAVGLDARWRPPHERPAHGTAADSRGSSGTPRCSRRRASARLQNRLCSAHEGLSDTDDGTSRGTSHSGSAPYRHSGHKRAAPCAPGGNAPPQRPRHSVPDPALRAPQQQGASGVAREPAVVVLVMSPGSEGAGWAPSSGSPSSASLDDTLAANSLQNGQTPFAAATAQLEPWQRSSVQPASLNASLAGVAHHLGAGTRVVQVSLPQQGFSGSEAAGSLVDRAAFAALQALGYVQDGTRAEPHAPALHGAQLSMHSVQTHSVRHGPGEQLPPSWPAHLPGFQALESLRSQQLSSRLSQLSALTAEGASVRLAASSRGRSSLLASQQLSVAQLSHALRVRHSAVPPPCTTAPLAGTGSALPAADDSAGMPAFSAAPSAGPLNFPMAVRLSEPPPLPTMHFPQQRAAAAEQDVFTDNSAPQLLPAQPERPAGCRVAPAPAAHATTSPFAVDASIPLPSQQHRAHAQAQGQAAPCPPMLDAALASLMNIGDVAELSPLLGSANLSGDLAALYQAWQDGQPVRPSM